MNEDHTARLLREQLDAELAQVRTTPRTRHDLHAALAAADVPATGRSGHGRAGRLASGSATGILLAAAAVTLIATVPAVLVDGSSPPAVPPPPTTGAPAGIPEPRPPATTPPPASDPTLPPSATAAPPPSPTASPSPAAELPRPPAQEPTSRRALALRLDATSVRAGTPVSPTVHWDVGASHDPRTAPAIPPVPTATAPPARTEVSVTWGDGATTSAVLPCPDQPDAQVEVPAHSYRTPGRYRLRVTTSDGCDLDVPVLLRVITVTR